MRFRRSAPIGLVCALLALSSARVRADEVLDPPPRWPRLVFDVGFAGRVYPNAGPSTLGPAIGALYRPDDKHCVHLALELRGDFGRIDRTGNDTTLRAFATSLGALWGRGTETTFFAVGAMFDLGYAHTVAATSDQGFVFSGAMRALVRQRLKKGFHVFAKVDLGHSIVAPTARDASGTALAPRGLFVGITLGAAFARVP